jgi:predicted nucleotide-binding protein
LSEPGEFGQQLVVHLFAPTDGAQAEPAYRALREMWLGCRQFFLMRDPLPYGGLPHQLPDSYQELPRQPPDGYRAEADEEVTLAAQERRDAVGQAFLRRHHDVLSLSVVLAAAPGSQPSPGHSWWQDLDSRWSSLSAGRASALLGEARVYLAGCTTPGPQLDDLLPADARVGRWRPDRAASDGPLALWEALPWADDRQLRRLVLTFPPDRESHDLASGWAWSDGSTAIPPLARYLLHAAKLRYQYRVWRRDGSAREFTAAVRSQAAAARQAPPGAPADDALASELRQRAAEARLMAEDLRELRQAVEIAEYNMGQAARDHLLTPGGPFADDRSLAGNFLALLDDDLRYLDIAADRATGATDLIASRRADPPTADPPAPVPGARPRAGLTEPDDITRNVFVVHGRDEQARMALFGFLRALGLNPLDWEQLVSATENASPYLRDVIMQGIAMAQAAVVLMTPDDVVRLHPDLFSKREKEHEPVQEMQARPNVILELGMALATYADRTIVLYAGNHRPMADLEGLNYIELTNDRECLKKIISRLETAGCQLGAAASVPGVRHRFRNLASYQRKPPG